MRALIQKQLLVSFNTLTKILDISPSELTALIEKDFFPRRVGFLLDQDYWRYDDILAWIDSGLPTQEAFCAFRSYKPLEN